MLSASRMLSALPSIGALSFLALWIACGAESPKPDTGAVRGAAGVSSAASGQGAATVPSAVSGAPATSSGGGSSGSGTPRSNHAAGTSSVGSAGSSAGVPGAAGGSAGAPVAAGSGGRGEAGAVAGAAAMSGSSAGAAGSGAPLAGCEVSPITDEMRDSYDNMNNAYYKKFASANGVIVATGSGVADEAVVRYCRLLAEMTSNAQVREAILREKMWFTMIADTEQLSSLPQIARDYGTSLNQRARGLGGLTPTICAEDSIMCMPGDRWKGDCICPHETGHTLYSSGIAKVSSLSSRLKTITANARSSGRIANSYVWMDGNESGMMAWGVQVWYDCAINGTKGAYHPDINTRAELQKELPEFHQFLSELLPADNEYKDCYANP
ncbi:MAG TPA: hypothetical protein VJR89_43875 [Polyangiales bacterium]|nr:hypothetical protein [Polyangiales bacterium]